MYFQNRLFSFDLEKTLWCIRKLFSSYQESLIKMDKIDKSYFEK